MQYDQSNDMFRMAVELVFQSSRNIFLTGKAGTGKTTFLKYIRENCSKQIAVVAPTGVAAINAGGATIHSFFQLPLQPFVPDLSGPSGKGFSNGLGFNDVSVNPHTLISRQRMNSEKLKVLQQLELLVIDEVSMVRCDTMDAIDTVLRHARKNHRERFGGVQVLFIGDMFQLSPVIRGETWSILSPYYEGHYFFDSRVIQEELPLYIEFERIYRQSEQKFIRLLNQVRNNQLDEEGLGILRDRFQPGFRRQKDDGYIVLTTHNDTVRRVNAAELDSLEGKEFSFKAEVENDFPENSFPGDETLLLKIGAQVMFIKNDPDKAKRFFNGKIGTVTKISNDKIFVQCKGDEEEIEVKREKWDNIRYTLNKTTQQMEEEVQGSFSQFPLRLAWAITIHKSQGLTFEKAIIDVGKAFAPGQVYVALSRCTSLAGLVLQSQVNPGSLSNDPRIVRFSESSLAADRLEAELISSRRKYEEELLISLFDLAKPLQLAEELLAYLVLNKSSFNPEAVSSVENWVSQLAGMQQTAEKFHPWIRQQMNQPVLAADNNVLQDRLSKASGHFSPILRLLLQGLRKSSAVTDSRLHAKEYNEYVKELFNTVSLKCFLLEEFPVPFSAMSYQERRSRFVIPAFNVNAYAGVADQHVESEHPLLHQELRKLRSAICARKNLPIYLVAGSKTIDEMARFLPLTKEELVKINGFGEAKVRQYGEEFLEVIQEYCMMHDLSSRIGEKSGSTKKADRGARSKSGTREESFRLYQEGLRIPEIANARKLTPQTIAGHLSYYIESGKIHIDELLEAGKLERIGAVIKELGSPPMKVIRNSLDDEVSFTDIRLALAWFSYIQSDVS